MARRNDQVFQLSLTEIAFTITFLLLLLLGYLVFREQTEKLAAQEALAKTQGAEQATVALEQAKVAVTSALSKAGSANPDEVISHLIAAEQVRVERDELRKRVDDLDAKLTALEELRNQLVQVAKANQPDLMKGEVDSALALQREIRSAVRTTAGANAASPGGNAASSKVAMPDAALATKTLLETQATSSTGDQAVRQFVKQALVTNGALRDNLKKQLNKVLEPGEEAPAIEEVVAAARSFGELSRGASNPLTMKKENSDLRGQVAFLKNRLDARGGRDFPPCWADENGKVEFLLSVEVRPDTVIAAPSWPQRRESAARELPGMADLLDGAHSHQEFVNKIQGIFNWSRKQDPECRHYVLLRSSISDAVQSDRARLMVENYFYKVETRR